MGVITNPGDHVIGMIENKTSQWNVSETIEDLKKKRNQSFDIDSLESLMSQKKSLDQNLNSLREYSDHRASKSVLTKAIQSRGRF